MDAAALTTKIISSIPAARAWLVLIITFTLRLLARCLSNWR